MSQLAHSRVLSSFLRRRFVLLALMLALAPAAGAWNDLGHMTVAYVAYQQMTPQVRQRASTLLKLNPYYSKWVAQLPRNARASDKDMMIFMLAATWADQIKTDPNYTNDGTDDGDRAPEGPSASQNIGYQDHDRHKYWHFVDTPFSQDGTPVGNVPLPNAQTQIAAFRAVLASDSPDELKSYDLTWVLHLVGDVHQPLHCVSRYCSALPSGDAGGNKVLLCAPPCRDELHGFWDDVLGTSKSPTAAISVAKTLPAADSTLVSETDEATWISESFEIAKTKVYVDPIGPGSGPYTLTSAYKTAARQLAAQRVALAGGRLANVLNKELK